MIFCERCFCDEEIISIIRNYEIQGECQICKSKDVYTYDTDRFDELSGLFDELVSIFTPSRLLPDCFPRAEMKLIKSELLENWNIFKSCSEADVYKIITSICKDKYQYMPELFDQPIGLEPLYDEEYLNKHSLLKTHTWKSFVDALKNQNRFHTNYINLEILEKFCSYIRKPYKKGSRFYRSRISSEKGLMLSEMGAPPSGKASEGRANALGISCLYLSDSVETTIHEVRASAFDYVTVGTFELQKDIVLVDLKRINKINPFVGELDFMEHAINKEHLMKINEELGKTLRRSDSTLDYLPTQYISDFIKSIKYNGETEYAGVEYNSVMNAGGNNTAIFDPSLFECVEVCTYRINDIAYHKRKIDG